MPRIILLILIVGVFSSYDVIPGAQGGASAPKASPPPLDPRLGSEMECSIICGGQFTLNSTVIASQQNQINNYGIVT